MTTIYAEIVSGKESTYSNVKLYKENPTTKTPIVCIGESKKNLSTSCIRIIEIGINDNGIIESFSEKGYKSRTQNGLRVKISEDTVAVIGEEFPITI